MYSMDFMILRKPKIRGILTRQKNVPNLVCVQQICARYEEIEYCSIDCERCGRRSHSYWNDPVGDLLTYLCEPRPWASKIVAVAHNAKAFDLNFILNRAIKLKWKPELIMNGLKNLSMKMEHLVFLDSVSFLPCALRNCPRLSVCRPLNHGTHTTLTPRKTSIMLGLCPTYRIMLWTRWGWGTGGIPSLVRGTQVSSIPQQARP